MKRTVIIITLILMFSAVSAQDAFYSIYSYDYFIPKVSINNNTHALQLSVMPRFYKNNSLNGDIEWVKQNDSIITEFWTSKGDTALHILTEISGLEWFETDININLVRYYPTLGSPNPLILPLGGINNGSFIEAAPEGNRLKLILIYLVAHRMLDQAGINEDSPGFAIANHPLMRPGIFRRDNLAMLLTLTTCYSIMGIDSTNDAFESSFIRNKFPGRKIFRDYFQTTWILTPDQTLYDRLIAEPDNSYLVSFTRPPRRKRTDEQKKITKFIENLPIKGQLGFSVIFDDNNKMVVDKIDMFRVAYACGLREGDIIRRVDGRLVLNQKQMIEYILESYDKNGSIVEISRDNMIEEIILQPLDLYYYDEYYYDYESDDDSSYIDSVNIDSLNEMDN